MPNDRQIKASMGSVIDTDLIAKIVRKDQIPNDQELQDKLNIPPEIFEDWPGHRMVGVDSGETFLLVVEHLTARQAVDAKAAALPWIGSPTSAMIPAGSGYVRHYENASVYWSSTFGAHEVHGAILERHHQMGGASSYLGLPQTDELTNGEVHYSNFQGGTIYWTAARGAFMLPSYDPITEKFATGAYVYIVGTGFTPGGRVSLWIVNAPNEAASMGSVHGEADGRLGSDPQNRTAVWLHNRPGDHEASIARAFDETTREASDRRLSYALY